MFIGHTDPPFCEVPVRVLGDLSFFLSFSFWEERGGREVGEKLSDFFLLTYSLHIQVASPCPTCIVNTISLRGSPFHPLIGIF